MITRKLSKVKISSEELKKPSGWKVKHLQEQRKRSQQIRRKICIFSCVFGSSYLDMVDFSSKNGKTYHFKVNKLLIKYGLDIVPAK